MTEQLHVLYVFLRRPAVQHQWLAFFAALALAWVLSRGLRRWADDLLRSVATGRVDSRDRGTVEIAGDIVGPMVLPLIGLALVWGAQGLFRMWERPGGLLGELVIVLWLILVYRLVTAVMSLALGEARERPFRVRLLAPLVGIFGLLRVMGLLIDLDAVAQVHVMTVSESEILLGPLFTTGLVLYSLFAASWAGQTIVQRAVLPRTAADPGLVHAGLTVARYVVIIIGVSFALGALGFDTSTVAFISGGLTVAIGFGSQQVFGNLVAGILLLFDQSLRPGDVISVAGELGVVENLSIRATTMRTADNVAVVMPNQSFITGAIRNYSKTQEGVRQQIPLAVAHDDEPRRVREVVLQTAKEHPAVREQPEPSVVFTALGKLPSGRPRSTLQVTVWLAEPLYLAEVTSDLLLALHDALAEEGMELV